MEGFLKAEPQAIRGWVPGSMRVLTLREALQQEVLPGCGGGKKPIESIPQRPGIVEAQVEEHPAEAGMEERQADLAVVQEGDLEGWVVLTSHGPVFLDDLAAPRGDGGEHAAPGHGQFTDEVLKFLGG